MSKQSNGSADSKIINSEVFETLDYEWFTFDKINRPIGNARVQDFIKEFKNGRNFMMDCPALVTPDGVVIDGQARITALMELGLPVFYRIAMQVGINEVERIQTNSQWAAGDSLHSNIQKGRKDYIALSKFMDEHNMKVSTAVMLLNGGLRTSLSKINFKYGGFKIKDGEKAARMAKIINEVGAATHFLHNQRFCTAMCKMAQHRDYSHKRMMKQLEKYRSLAIPQVNADGYRDNLVYIFNYRTRSGKRGFN